MSRKRFGPEQIIAKLRKAEVLLSKGQTVAEMCCQIGVHLHTYDRWRREYGGLEVDQANLCVANRKTKNPRAHAYLDKADAPRVVSGIRAIRLKHPPRCRRIALAVCLFPGAWQ